MKLISKIQELKGKHIEKILKITLLILVSFYFFWLPSFSDRSPFNYFTYPLLLLLTGICLILLIVNKKVFICREVIFILLAYLFFSLFSTLIHVRVLGLDGLREWLRLLFLFLSFFVLFNSFNIIYNKDRIIYALLIPLLLFAGYYLIIYFKDIIALFKGSDKRLGAYFNNVNTLSSFFALGYLISFYQIFNLKKITRFVFITFCALFIFLGYTTGSRQFLLSLFVSTFVFLIWKFRTKKAFLVTIIGLLITSIVLIFTVPQLTFIRNKFLFLFDSADSKDLSAVQRLLMQVNAIFEGGKNFVFGHGQLSFSFYTSFDGYSHNAFTNSFFESGIIGLFCLILLLTLILRNGAKLKDEYFGIIILLLVYYFIVGFFSVWFREKPFYVSLSFMCFLIYEKNFKKEKVIQEMYSIDI